MTMTMALDHPISNMNIQPCTDISVAQPLSTPLFEPRKCVSPSTLLVTYTNHNMKEKPVVSTTTSDLTGPAPA